jgi:hypothetical protein
LAAAGVLLTGAAGFVACSDDDDDAAGDTTPVATQAATAAATKAASTEEKAVQQWFLDAIDRWNAKDLEGFVAFFTDEGLVSSFGDDVRTAAEVKAGLGEFIGSEELGQVTFLETSVSGDAATLDVVFAFGTTLTRSKFALVKVGGEWKQNNEESNLPVDVPAGTTLVHIDANEFAFGVDTSTIVGTVAFEFSNVGKQHHELGIVRIPADANIEDLLQQAADSPDGEVAGVEFVGGTDADSGDTTNIVFIEPLAPGRYMMACFVPDETEGEDGTPHALKGMYKEFTIE